LNVAGLEYVLREYAHADEQHRVRSSVENDGYPCWADLWYSSANQSSREQVAGNARCLAALFVRVFEASTKMLHFVLLTPERVRGVNDSDIKYVTQNAL
jgi:hypothetical protein